MFDVSYLNIFYKEKYCISLISTIYYNKCYYLSLPFSLPLSFLLPLYFSLPLSFSLSLSFSLFFAIAPFSTITPLFVSLPYLLSLPFLLSLPPPHTNNHPITLWRRKNVLGGGGGEAPTNSIDPRGKII